MSLNRWRCSKHHNAINLTHKSDYVPRHHKFYERQTTFKSHHAKKIYNKRLGVSYDCTIKRYYYAKDIRNRPIELQDNYERFTYFKLYNSVEFDVVLTKKQRDRWNRITRVSLGPEPNSDENLCNNHRFSTAHTATIPVKNKIIKTIQHIPEKFLPRNPCSIIRKKEKQTAKNYRRRRNRKIKENQKIKKPDNRKGKRSFAIL
jgi:hypothetical protein